MGDKEQWIKRKVLYNELHQLEAEIEKEEQPQPEKTECNCTGVLDLTDINGAIWCNKCRKIFMK